MTSRFLLARVTTPLDDPNGAYFGAFPAAYWRHWTHLRTVTLSTRTAGAGQLRILRSDASGQSAPVETITVADSAETVRALPLGSFEDGGWYWFELSAGLELLGATWSADTPPLRASKLTLGTTTMNKPDYVLQTLGALADAPELLAEIDRILVIDQGTDRVTAQAGFEEARSRLDDRLQVIEQANLGGSGGFARAMYEGLQLPGTGSVLLLDDDVRIDAESILRLLRFSRYCAEPTIVGGQMLDLAHPTVLHAFAEIVDRTSLYWGPAFPEQLRHDLATSGLASTPWMHRRLDADYNGWWMCLIPVEVLRSVGLAAPLFIKWDDAEYGLRAQDAGIATVTLPGAAIWHVSWLDKDDTQDWQAYYHARNRIVTALLHSSSPRGRAVLRASANQDVKQLLMMQYYAITLRHRALQDVLAGPGGMHEALGSTLPRLREAAARFPEKKVYREGDRPSTRLGLRHPANADRKFAPRGIRLAGWTAAQVLRHWVRRTPEDALQRPNLELTRGDATWWVLPRADSVLVPTADGAGLAWYRRDRAQFRRLLTESVRLHRTLRRSWPRLAEDYRAALPELTSPETWETTFSGR
jgi:galactofuranosylgalactofuranosylrhamnosyl-N-acetylglucosaminyl-diphospho-decaprenol beta-1,5/1,6-galactofuranosyltransferase